jgi:hypothetical protein
MSKQPHIPAEKPFTPFPPSHPILPPDAPNSDPARDVPVPEHERDGNRTHPHKRNGPLVEDNEP